MILALNNTSIRITNNLLKLNYFHKQKYWFIYTSMFQWQKLNIYLFVLHLKNYCWKPNLQKLLCICQPKYTLYLYTLYLFLLYSSYYFISPPPLHWTWDFINSQYLYVTDVNNFLLGVIISESLGRRRDAKIPEHCLSSIKINF